MKKILISGILAVLLIVTGTYFVNASSESKTVDVMFLHDTHSHLNEFATVEDGKTQVLGGFAKLKTLIEEKKEEKPESKPAAQEENLPKPPQPPAKKNHSYSAG